MNDREKSQIHLVAWSGGLDSTWLVWDLCRQGAVVCADHYRQVGLPQRGQRLSDAQLLAINALAPKLELAGLTCRTVHPEEKDSKLDIVWTTEITIDDTVQGLAAWPHWYYVGVRNDENRTDQLSRQATVREVWELHAPAWSKIMCPAIGISRKEMWDQLPEDIRRNTWSCRNPVLRAGRFSPCYACRACRELVAAGVPVNRWVDNGLET